MQLPEIFLSLRQMSLCNIALQVFNDPDVRLFSSTHTIHCCIWSSEEIESLLGKEPSTMLNNAEVAKILSKRIKPNLSHKYKYLFTGNGKDFSLTSKQLEILVDQKLSTLSLPNMFRNEVMTFVRFVIVESYKWSQDHEELMVFTTDFTNSFQWTQDNKIDRQKTAKAIIADDNINLIDRFVMASHYCIQEDVLSIWGMLHHSQKNYIDVGTDIVRMWAKWARYGGEIDWDQIDEVPFTMFGFQPCFPKVKQEKRLQYLKDHYRVIWSNYHELKLFLSVLDQNDRNEILKKFPLQILEMFLDWSLQTKLLDVVELLWPYLSEYDVRDFLFLILSRKRMLNWIGSDYVTFVAKLQERFSYGYEVFKEMYPPLFNTLKLVHENDGPRPSPHEVCLQSNDNILIAFLAKLQEGFSYGYKVFKAMYSPLFNTLKLVHENDGPRPSPHEVCLQSNDNILIAFHSGNNVFVLSKSKGDFTEFLNSLCAVVYKYKKKDCMCFI